MAFDEAERAAFRQGMETLHYHVAPADPAAHRFVVELEAGVPPGRPWVVMLPNWIPGSYVMRDFARHVLSIEGIDPADGEPLAVTALDRHRWSVTPRSETVRLRVHVYARDPSVRAAFLDDTRGFFNFTSLALRPVDGASRAVRVTIAPPPAEYDWTLVTTLAPDTVDARGFGTYRAADYWDLIDHPVAMGPAVESVSFDVHGVAHAFVLLGGHDADTRQLAADLAPICRAQAAVFDAPPASPYRFFAQVTATSFGGIEHRDSSVLQVPRHALPSAARATASGGRHPAYEDLLALASHEYFHRWNVKRIRPAAVAESTLSEEAYFRDLWAYEGVTSYYDDLALVRAGLIDEQGYLDRLARLATRVARTPGRHVQTLAQSSFDAWLKFYRPDENTPNAVVSYYAKGAQLALGLDLHLRLGTAGRVSLDTVMREAWAAYGRNASPVPEHGLARLAERVSGLDLGDFFREHLETTADAPWADHLGAFGIRAVAEPADDPAAVLLGRLGVIFADDGGSAARIRHVIDEGPAQRAGLAPDDRLLALDGVEWGSDPVRLLARYPAGAALRVHLFRDDCLLVREITLAAEGAPRWQLSVDPNAKGAAHARRAAWLHHDPPDG